MALSKFASKSSCFEWSEQQNRQKRIAEFEALLGENDADKDEGGLALRV